MADPIRTLVATLARGPLASGAARAAEAMAPWRPGRLAILTYHRVDEPGERVDLMPNLVSATPAALEAQLAALVRHYRPVSLAEVIDALPDPRRLPPRAVLVTVDDAYRDVASTVWPTLRALGVPATLFVPTGLVGRPGQAFWWDRLAAAAATTQRTSVVTPDGPLPVGSPAAAGPTVRRLVDRLKTLDHDLAMAEVERLVGELGEGPVPDRTILDWDELRALAAEGLTLAPHSRHHPLLDRVSFATAVDEIAGSHADLEREIGPTPAVLAYPSGAHGGRAVEAARSAGMRVAMTTVRGGNDLRRSDPLRWQRINVGFRAQPPLIRGQLVWASTIESRRRRPG